jgi:hypothetical protein
VSNHGRVWNLLGEERVGEEVDEDEGYLGVYLTDDEGRYFFVPIDVLVVEAFLGPIDGLEGIDHLDGDPWNNQIWNLQVTDAYWGGHAPCDDCE